MKSRSFLRELPIPLLPLARQRQVVAELEGERALVEADRELMAWFERKRQAKRAEIGGIGA